MSGLHTSRQLTAVDILKGGLLMGGTMILFKDDDSEHIACQCIPPRRTQFPKSSYSIIQTYSAVDTVPQKQAPRAFPVEDNDW